MRGSGVNCDDEKKMSMKKMDERNVDFNIEKTRSVQIVAWKDDVNTHFNQMRKAI